VRAHGSSTLFSVVGLEQEAALIGPETIESADDVLKIHITSQAIDPCQGTGLCRGADFGKAVEQRSTNPKTGL